MKHGANTTIIVSGLVAFASVGCTPASEKSATERREGVDAPSSCVSSPTASSKGSEATLREMIAGKKMIPQNKTNGLDETFDEYGSWASVAAEIDITYRSGLWDINVDEHSREQLCTTLTEQDGEAISPPVRTCYLIKADFARCEATLSPVDYPSEQLRVRFVEPRE